MGFNFSDLPFLASLNLAPVSAFFDSLYESFQALTSIQVSHFVEWFSGDALDSIWTQRDVAGTNIFAMDDVIDGGFEIEVGTNNADNGAIDFNNKRHYAHDDSIVIFVIKRNSANNLAMCGMSGNTSYNVLEVSRFENRGDLSFERLTTADASTSSSTDSTVAPTTNWQNVKIESQSANILLYIDGVLEVTKSTNRPTTKQQPFFHSYHLISTGSGVSASIRYLEAYNTSITLLSSLYERLSALTQVMGQRVVETFSGSVLNERWTFQNLAGTNSGAMKDEVDGGYEITSDTSTDDRAQIYFNDKRQYDETNCIAIFVAKRVTASTRLTVGMVEQSPHTNDFAVIENDTSNTNQSLTTADASTNSETEGSVPIDTSWHSYKVECSSANIKSYIDGVLDVTKTTNRPTNRLQPSVMVQTRTTSAATVQVRYLEAYNKLTTETDFPSVYEMFNALTTVAKQHFWDWFDGSILNNRWTTENISGTNTFAMDDAVDGGFKISNQAVASAKGTIHFNNKRQFDETACICIAVHKRNTASSDCTVGFRNDASTGLNFANLRELTTNTFKTLITGDGSTNSAINSDIVIDTSWHSYKVECGSANIKLTIDGVLKVTKTTNRPAARLQPMMRNDNTASASATSSIRYIEAKNT